MLRASQPRLFVLGTVRRWMLEKLEAGNSHPVQWIGTDRNTKPGYHWLEWRYTPTLSQIIWYNMIRVRWTHEVLVGKDWRDNLFFVKMDGNHPMKHYRFAKFVEPWELKQDYDADNLWKLWLEYRLESAPSPQACARAFKYKEERYSIWQMYLRKREEEDAKDPPEEKIRRFQEYRDQKWDIRRQRQIMAKLWVQKWVWARNMLPEIANRRTYGRWKMHYEADAFYKLDLLRPPSRQRLWKLEDDIRTWKHIDRIENPKYLLDPFEHNQREVHMLTPSYVAGEPLPQKLQVDKRPTSRYEMQRPLRGGKPMAALSELGVSRVSQLNPFPHFSDSNEFDEWFADQRMHLVAARAELEQMKRDGFRPLALGGDADPYQMSKAVASPDQAYKNATQLLAEARDERTMIEKRKSEAAVALLGYDPKVGVQSQHFTKPPEPFVSAVLTEEGGRIQPGSAALYAAQKQLEGGGGEVLEEGEKDGEEDEDLRAGTKSAGVVSVFDQQSVFGAIGKPEEKGKVREVAPDERGPL
eukprot:TRINITY_DN39985_c0_g1_i1.p1 TRINITY_DN39985_c0_g1~~TRINITY_DN39985_c0_g1_i1.p1  ORF type:complete len:526 (+),score=173.44 TRINITY_DN39985_c0_g1_i1:107-1684(+)